jgi:TPR repeat protein
MSFKSWFGKPKKTFKDLLQDDAPVTMKDLLELDEIQCRPEVVAAALILLKDPKHSHDGYDILGPLAAAGDAEAQFIMGEFRESAMDRPDKAAIWFQRAADQGHAKAQRNYADMLMTGRGVQRDLRQASIYYEKAAKSGVAEAQFVMGELSRVGNIIPQNLAEARRWYELAVQNGYQAAKKRLEQMSEGIRE